MKVHAIKTDFKTGKEEIYCPLDGVRHKLGDVAELHAYTNKINGLPDPRVEWAPGRWIHLSTCIAKGYDIREVESGAPVVHPAMADVPPEQHRRRAIELFG